jgi:hypothetical protein
MLPSTKLDDERDYRSLTRVLAGVLIALIAVLGFSVA